jgi:DNA-directed RNA polymerase subunit RPC12/RpoP
MLPIAVASTFFGIRIAIFMASPTQTTKALSTGTSKMTPVNDKLRCQRCGSYDEIPTHQFVKFDMKLHYVCGRCWEEFRRWFLKGNSTLNGGSEKEHKT